MLNEVAISYGFIRQKELAGLGTQNLAPLRFLNETEREVRITWPPVIVILEDAS